MVSRPLLGLAAVALACSAAPLYGQSVCELFEHHAAKDMAVGSYAVWQFTDGTMKQAVVGTQDVNGERHIWFEMAVRENTKGVSMVAKLLVPSFARLSEVKEMVVQPAGEPAIRPPAQMMPMFRRNIPDPLAEMQKKCDAGVEDLGTEKVTVPAGTFSARHFRAAGGEEMWIDMTLAFPVVKMTSDQGDMVLAGHGTDATSAITGPIQDMPEF